MSFSVTVWLAALGIFAVTNCKTPKGRGHEIKHPEDKHHVTGGRSLNLGPRDHHLTIEGNFIVEYRGVQGNRRQLAESQLIIVGNESCRKAVTQTIIPNDHPTVKYNAPPEVPFRFKIEFGTLNNSMLGQKCTAVIRSCTSEWVENCLSKLTKKTADRIRAAKGFAPDVKELQACTQEKTISEQCLQKFKARNKDQASAMLRTVSGIEIMMSTLTFQLPKTQE